MKKVPFGELAFVLGVVFTCMGVALMVSSDLGLSMVAAPAYILGEKFAFLTTGMAEWGIQGTLFILGCVLMRRFSFPLLLSLAVAALNAAVLDMMLAIFAGVSAASFMGQLFLYLLGFCRCPWASPSLFAAISPVRFTRCSSRWCRSTSAGTGTSARSPMTGSFSPSP